MPANVFPTISAAVLALQAGGVTRTIVQRGDGSGDQSHVIPLLAMPVRHGVFYGVLVIDATVPPGPLVHGRQYVVGGPTAPKGQNMADAYVDAFRVAVARVAYVNLGAMGMTAAIAGNLPHGMQKLNLTTTTQRSTALVLGAKADRTAIKEQFRGPKTHGLLPTVAVPALHPAVLDDMQLDLYRHNQGITLANHVVVIWGRKSGKRGGLYPEMDSSAEGMAQVAQQCMALGYTVVVAGDIVQAKMATHAGFAGAIWLGDFWNRWPVANRRDLQIRFFYILGKQLKQQAPPRRLVHVGMRSGGMDMYTYSGQRVVYIVAPVNAGGGVNDARMGPVAAALGSAANVGAYSFDRVIAQQVPKRWGNDARPKGFGAPDIGAITGQITTTLNRP